MKRATLLSSVTIIFCASISYAYYVYKTTGTDSEAIIVRIAVAQDYSENYFEKKPDTEASSLKLHQSHSARKKESSEKSNLIPIVNQKDIHPADRILLNDILNWMTPLCRNNLKNLIVRYDQNADRGQSTSSTILLRGGMPNKESIAVMIHECGHIVDLGAYKGTPQSGISNFPDGITPTYNNDPSILFYQISWQNVQKIKMESSQEDFVSGYAMTDPWEDVAESIVYYALHEDVFRKRAEKNKALMKKLNWVETYVFGKEFETASSSKIDDRIVWDITKLPHGLAF